MKKNYLIVLFSILFLTFTACDKVKELTDVKFQVELDEDVDADLQGNGENNSFVLSILNDEVEPYRDNLKEVEIEKIKLKIKAYSGTTEDVILKLNTDGIVLFSQRLNMQQLFDNQTEVEINDLEVINQLADKLLNNEEVVVNYTTQTINNENVEMYFTLNVYIKATVTASPLP